VRRGSPHPTACGSVCQDWWLQEHRPYPNAPRSADLHRELTRLRTRTRLIPSPRTVLGGVRIAGANAAGLAAGYVGFRIGSGPLAKILKIGVPNGRGTWSGAVEWVYKNGNFDYQDDLGGWVATPGPSLVLYRVEGNNNYLPRWQGRGTYPFAHCAPAYAAPVLNYLAKTLADSCKEHYYASPTPYSYATGYHLIRVDGPEGIGGAAGTEGFGGWGDGGIEDADGSTQPVVREVASPPDPGFDDTLTSVQAELGARPGEYPVLIPWIEWMFGEGSNPVTGEVYVPQPQASPGETYESYAQKLRDRGLVPVRVEAAERDHDFDDDSVVAAEPNAGTRVEPESEVRVTVNPPSTESDSRDCELVDGPPAGDPAPERGDDFMLKYVTVTSPLGPEVFPRNTGGGLAETRLRFGHTFIGRRGTWAGWGWRHVAAKHSWTPADREATRVALLMPPMPAGGGTFVYDGPEYPGRNDAVCKRRVVVQTQREPDEEDADVGPKEIITSYGKAVPADAP
jgi:hypothetical protein